VPDPGAEVGVFDHDLLDVQRRHRPISHAGLYGRAFRKRPREEVVGRRWVDSLGSYGHTPSAGILEAMDERSFLVLLHDFALDLGLDLTEEGARPPHAATSSTSAISGATAAPQPYIPASELTAC